MDKGKPTPVAIEKLHKKYAPNQDVFHLVFIHCQIVSEIAVQLSRNCSTQIDVERVKIGCLLHDVGVYPLFDKNGLEKDKKRYITHGILGEEILKNEGYDEEYCRFASHHTGVGITKQQITKRRLPLPLKDYVAESTEEELVMYADKFHSKTNPPVFNSFNSYQEYVARFGVDAIENFQKLAEKFGKPNLSHIAKKYKQDIR